MRGAFEKYPTIHCGSTQFFFGLATAALLALVSGCSSVGSQGPLLDTTTSWDGGPIAYPEGEARITSVILRINEGDQLPFHCHPVPTLGYVLKGEVEVETPGGEKTVIKQGESVVEVMRTLHRGRALKAPVEILVFYAGATNVPTTVLPQDDPDRTFCTP